MQSVIGNLAPILVAVATLVTALASAVVVVVNAFRNKRIESKVDAGAVVQDKIHDAVNGGMAAALEKIAALEAEVRRLQP